MRMVTKKAEVLDHLKAVGYDKEDYRIAVEALIFTPDGKLLLEKRGPLCKDAVGLLEGVGGGLDEHDEDLHEALRHEISTELSGLNGDLKVSIDRLLEIRQIQFEESKTKRLKEWVVVSYLCKLIEGEPVSGEPELIEELVYLTLDELYAKPESELSGSTIAARKVYQEKYGNRPYFEVPESPDGR